MLGCKEDSFLQQAACVRLPHVLLAFAARQLHGPSPIRKPPLHDHRDAWRHDADAQRAGAAAGRQPPHPARVSSSRSRSSMEGMNAMTGKMLPRNPAAAAAVQRAAAAACRCIRMLPASVRANISNGASLTDTKCRQYQWPIVWALPAGLPSSFRVGSGGDGCVPCLPGCTYQWSMHTHTRHGLDACPACVSSDHRVVKRVAASACLCCSGRRSPTRSASCSTPQASFPKPSRRCRCAAAEPAVQLVAPLRCMQAVERGMRLACMWTGQA